MLCVCVYLCLEGAIKSLPDKRTTSTGVAQYCSRKHLRLSLSLSLDSHSDDVITFFARDERQVASNCDERVHDVSAKTRVDFLRPEVVLDVVEAEYFLAIV